MKLKTVKFFQPIEVPTAKPDQHDVAMSVRIDKHDIFLKDGLLTITHRDSGHFVLATLHNVCYMRPEDDNKPDTKATPSPKAVNKTKQGQD